MREGYGAVMRIMLLDQDMAIEATHLLDREYADTTEGTCRHVEDFALCDVGTKNAFGIALETIEGDVAGSDVSLKGAAGEVRLGSFRLKQTMLDQLILDRAVRAHLALRSISAMEAHEGVGQGVVELALDILIIDILRYRVINVKQGNGICGYAKSDILAQRAINVDLTGYRDAAAFSLHCVPFGWGVVIIVVCLARPCSL